MLSTNKFNNHMTHTMDNINSQNQFLEDMLKREEYVTVFLINGVKLKGVITAHDDISILLSRDESMQLVYKHAISTMMPMTDKI